jgi:hypothetical protein
MKYQYSPESSPFRNLKQMRYFKLIDHIPSHFLRSGINYTLFNTYYKRMSLKLGIDGFGTHNIPYKFLTNFDFSLYKSLWGKQPFENIPTIFDLLRVNNLRTYYSHGIKQNLPDEIMRSSFSTIYLSDIDFYAHIFGLKSWVFWNHVRKLDKKVEFIVEHYKKIEKNPNVMIFADHGMSQVDKIIDFKYLLKHRDYNKKFFMVPDGTMLRFWYHDNDVKSEIRNYLSDYTYGNFLTNEEKKQLHLDFKHKKYFEDIFLLNQGYSIFPNFMSWNTPKAMHAYHPAYKEQHGALIFSGKAFDSIKERTAYLADLMPTMLDCLNIEVPITSEGSSLVK